MIVDVIIPALNEERSLPKVLAEIPRPFVRNIYVCDNGSTDLTASVSEAGGAITLKEPKRGYGAACLKCMRHISSSYADHPPNIIVFIDADYSDFPEEMVPMVKYLIDNNLDMVIGSRVLGKPEIGSLTKVQRFGNGLATYLIRLIYGYTFTDLGPFRAIQWKSLLALDMKDTNYGWTVEMQVKAAKAKMKTGEIPVSYRKRIGISKVSGTLKGVISAGYKIIITILKHS